MALWSLLVGRRQWRARRAALADVAARSPEDAATHAFFHQPVAPASTVELRFNQAFLALQARVYVLCLALLALSILFLFWDLGSPERVLLILFRPHATVLTFGALVLTAEAVLGALLAAASLLNLRVLQGHAKRTLEILACIVSLAVMAYTGVFLLGNIGVPFWNTWTIVGLFLFSSLSCGLTLMLLVDYFVQDQTLLLRAARPLQKWHLACLAGEAIFVALFLLAAFDNPAAAGALEILRSPDMLPAAVIGVLGFGIVAPAACEIYALTRQDCRTIPVSDALCLAGGLILRFCIIACGIH